MELDYINLVLVEVGTIGTDEIDENDNNGVKKEKELLLEKSQGIEG